MRKLEAVLLGVGLTLLATFVGFRIHSVVGSRAALRQFAAKSAVPVNSGTALQAQPGQPDFSLWSEERIKAYRQSRTAALDEPLAVLTIPRLSLEVPVFEGTDELALNRGAGRIAGTAKPGQAGNVGIASHRDGFFRCLKDVQIGDRIELATLNGKAVYAVGSIDIVFPDDVSVLEPTRNPTVTLVTCYPFYFVGHAPQRFIVRASSAGPALGGSLKPNTGAGANN